MCVHIGRKKTVVGLEKRTMNASDEAEKKKNPIIIIYRLIEQANFFL
jgi:hypothetical protein